LPKWHRYKAGFFPFTSAVEPLALMIQGFEIVSSILKSDKNENI